MSKREAIKMLKTEEKIVCLDQKSQAMFASLALSLLYKGQEIKATLEKGWGK